MKVVEVGKLLEFMGGQLDQHVQNLNVWLKTNSVEVRSPPEVEERIQKIKDMKIPPEFGISEAHIFLLNWFLCRKYQIKEPEEGREHKEK